jgi:hypothetical protein
VLMLGALDTPQVSQIAKLSLRKVKHTTKQLLGACKPFTTSRRTNQSLLNENVDAETASICSLHKHFPHHERVYMRNRPSEID